MAGKVLFTAVADQGGPVGPFQTDQTLVFSKVITNIGDGYDSSSGVFRAPFDGFYYFCFFYHAGKEHKSGLTLVKNSEVIVKSFDESRQRPENADNGGNSAFLKLNRGEKVFVRLPANHHVWASDSATTFSGFLISEI